MDGSRRTHESPSPPQGAAVRARHGDTERGADARRRQRSGFPVAGGPRVCPQQTLHAASRDWASRLCPHGFRSSFRDWCGECSNAPREVAEAALAHAVRNKVEAAYARSDLFERRRVLMADWEAYLADES